MIKHAQATFACDWCEREVIVAGVPEEYMLVAKFPLPENWTQYAQHCSDICDVATEVATFTAMANCARRGEKRDAEQYPGFKEEFELLKAQRRTDVEMRRRQRDAASGA